MSEPRWVDGGADASEPRWVDGGADASGPRRVDGGADASGPRRVDGGAIEVDRRWAAPSNGACRKRFAGLMSRCTIPSACAAASPRAAWMNTRTTGSGSSGPRILRSLARSTPCRSSMMMNGVASVRSVAELERLDHVRARDRRHRARLADEAAHGVVVLPDGALEDDLGRHPPPLGRLRLVDGAHPAAPEQPAHRVPAARGSRPTSGSVSAPARPLGDGLAQLGIERHQHVDGDALLAARRGAQRLGERLDRRIAPVHVAVQRERERGREARLDPRGAVLDRRELRQGRRRRVRRRVRRAELRGVRRDVELAHGETPQSIS